MASYKRIPENTLCGCVPLWENYSVVASNKCGELKYSGRLNFEFAPWDCALCGDLAGARPLDTRSSKKSRGRARLPVNVA